MAERIALCDISYSEWNPRFRAVARRTGRTSRNKEESRMKMCVIAIAVLMVACAAKAAEVKTEKLTYLANDRTMIGYLAYPADGKGPLPGVLVVHEWMGLNQYPKHRAEQLAAMGYVALAADIYGDGKVARDTAEALQLATELKKNRPELRQRAQAALSALKGVKMVDPKRVAAIGYCFGGTTVLELARDGAELRGVVCFPGGLETDMPAAPKSIHTAVLACQGADDPNVPPKEVAGFEDEMRSAGTDWQLIVYGGTVHSFTNPDAGNDPSRGAAYNATSDRRSWDAITAFLRERFAAAQ
jgi:dienelactone hydrolase